MVNVTISYQSLERELERLKKIILNLSGQCFVSFQSGLPSDWERYKFDIYNEGQRRLGVKDWNKKDIGKGKIAKSVINAIEIDDSALKLVNNLCDWNKRFGEKSQAHRFLLDAVKEQKELFEIEEALFNLYKGIDQPKISFDKLIKFAGSKYPLIAYLFFLKDIEQFLPIRPNVFDEAFEILEIDLVTSRKCSYDNYVDYLGVIKQIRNGLRAMGHEDTSLIDAHSFCWLLVNLKDDSDNKPKPPKIIQFKPLHIDESVDYSNHNMTSNSMHNLNDANIGRDYLAEHNRNMIIGRQSEELVIEYEIDRLKKNGLEELAKSVKDVSLNPEYGYDVESFEEDGTKRFIEVKTANWSGKTVSFYVSPNQIDTGKKLENYYFYLVSDIKNSSVIHALSAKDLLHEYLEPMEYRARIPTIK